MWYADLYFYSSLMIHKNWREACSVIEYLILSSFLNHIFSLVMYTWNRVNFLNCWQFLKSLCFLSYVCICLCEWFPPHGLAAPSSKTYCSLPTRPVFIEWGHLNIAWWAWPSCPCPPAFVYVLVFSVLQEKCWCQWNYILVVSCLRRVTIS